jgi:hypothetical protein
VDAVQNYFLCNSSFNRAIGNKVDDMNCYLVGKERCQVAVALSTSINGYDGPDHGTLYSRVRNVSIVKPILIHMESHHCHSPPNLTGLLLFQINVGSRGVWSNSVRALRIEVGASR